MVCHSVCIGEWFVCVWILVSGLLVCVDIGECFIGVRSLSVCGYQ